MAPHGSQRRGSFKRGGIFSIQHRHQASARQVGRSERLQQWDARGRVRGHGNVEGERRVRLEEQLEEQLKLK